MHKVNTLKLTLVFRKEDSLEKSPVEEKQDNKSEVEVQVINERQEDKSESESEDVRQL